MRAIQVCSCLKLTHHKKQKQNATFPLILSQQAISWQSCLIPSSRGMSLVMVTFLFSILLTKLFILPEVSSSFLGRIWCGDWAFSGSVTLDSLRFVDSEVNRVLLSMTLSLIHGVWKIVMEEDLKKSWRRLWGTPSLREPPWCLTLLSWCWGFRIIWRKWD